MDELGLAKLIIENDHKLKNESFAYELFMNYKDDEIVSNSDFFKGIMNKYNIDLKQ